MVVVRAGFPREVVRVDGDAVSSDAGAGVERDEPEGFGRGSRDDVPDVDTQLVANDGHFVRERAVDDPEGVFEDFRHFRLPRAFDDVDGRIEHGFIQFARDSRTLRRASADDFRRVFGLVARVAGVDSFGREGEMDVASDDEARLFEERPEDFVGGPGVGRGFEHDEHRTVKVRDD